MLVSHSKRFIYTKTRKTAGTSIEAYFEPYCLARPDAPFSEGREMQVSRAGIVGFRGATPGPKHTWYNHMPASRVRSQLGEPTWTDYFKFCVVRNPYDRLVSAFYFEHKALQPSAADPELFREWLFAGACERFVDRDQYAIDGHICMDYLIRYEALEEGLAAVCGRLGIPFRPGALRRLKSGFRPAGQPLSGFYDGRTLDLMRKVYAFEIERFGYAAPEVART